jgi:xylan 1,4-beta-xylosidase
MKRALLAFLIAWSIRGFGQSSARKGFREMHVDAAKVTGTIRSFQGVNGVPTPIMAGLPNLEKQYKDLRVDVIRTHDTMGPTDVDARFSVGTPLLAWLVPDTAQRAQLVEAGNAAAIFPDWAADPEKPESYNFAPTDRVIEGIRATGAEVYYRIGRSWGADYTDLPDLDKFAAVVKHIAMHYDQGWARGSRGAVKYWEFWNEEDTLFFWTDTPDTFFNLYEKTARALKAVNPSLQVGADAKAFSYDGGPYREGLLDYCAQHKVPLDFYSWHHYTMASADPYDFNRIGAEIRTMLDARGFKQAQSVLSEWNLTPDFTEAEQPRLQGIVNAAFMGDVLIYLQDSTVDVAHFYRADAAWMGLFGLKGEYLKPAYAFEAAGKMLATPQRLELSGSDTVGLAALAGRSSDGKTVQILIANYEIPKNYKPPPMTPPPGSEPQNMPMPDFSKMKSLPPRTDIAYKDNAAVHLVVENLPWGKGGYRVQRYRLTETENFTPTGETLGKGGKVELSERLAPPALELIVIQRK